MDSLPSSSNTTLSHRKTMGRSARRRRKKLLEIQKAEEELFNNKPASSSSTTTSTLQVIPSDRHRVWPGVQERRDDFGKPDAARMVAQLGYLPGNATRVQTRAKEVPLLQKLGVDAEEPVVLQLYPMAVRDEHTGGKCKRKKKQRKRTRMITEGLNAEEEFVVEPFPTLYWLTHPLLRTLVSKLELQQRGIQLENKLAGDSEALASMERANQAYGQERSNLLSATDIDYIQQRNWQPAFDPARGVAGIKNYASVKCLHAHVAHYLSGGKGSADNIIGRWVMEETEQDVQAKLDKKESTSSDPPKEATDSTQGDD